MGVSRIMLVTQFMEQNKLMRVAPSQKPSVVIGIVCYLLPKEQEEYGHRARQYCLELKRNLEAMALAMQPWVEFQMVLDLRTKPKLSDKLNVLMNN